MHNQSFEKRLRVFPLIDTTEPNKRMEELFRFVEHWYGKSMEVYKTSNPPLTDIQLPTPLYCLYEFLGKWSKSESIHGDLLFCHQDCLLSLENLSYEGDKVIFASENQGNWQMATLTTGEDPPVWHNGQLEDEKEPWTKFSDSLSNFLISFCLQEALMGAKYYSDQDRIKDFLLSTGEPLEALWLEGDYVYFSHQYEFHLYKKTLLMGFVLGSYWFGTNDISVVNTLKANGFRFEQRY